jgi:hypothetical protein
MCVLLGHDRFLSDRERLLDLPRRPANIGADRRRGTELLMDGLLDGDPGEGQCGHDVEKPQLVNR